MADSEGGPAWSREQARLGARELTDVDADTSDLIVERGPDELAFCHAAFREHLAGLELATRSLEDQIEFVSCHAGEPRWRGAILALLQSLKRRADVERILEAILDENEGAPDSTDRRLLLADGAFATASLSGSVGRQAARDSLSRIEAGTDDAEGLELLGMALDGPRAGPIGEAIVTRLGRWWPGVTEWQADVYAQLGRWHPTEELAQTLQLALRGDSNQLAAASSLARVFGGRPEVGCRLIALIHESVNPWVRAAALDALSRGWPSIDDLDSWLHEAERSPSIQLRTVAALALYRRGRRGDEGRDSLLRALGAGWSRFSGSLHAEIMDALVADWADDSKLQDACWARVGMRGPPTYDIGYENARSMLMRLHREDPRVPRWVQEKLGTRDYFPFGGTLPGDALLEPILSEHANVRAAVETWFEENSASHDYSAAQLAAMLRSDEAKRAMLSRLAETGPFLFWPVWSLLHGWGIDDPEVAAALEPLPRIPPEERQHIAHHVPANRRVAAFGGLLALGRIDVFAGAKEGSDDKPLRVDLVGQFKDYAPVLELVAERWEELETATGEFPVSRLSRWNDDPASFWRSLAPYLSRSSRLRTRFLEYCDDGSMVLQAPALLALARLVGPGSSLLLCLVDVEANSRAVDTRTHARGVGESDG